MINLVLHFTWYFAVSGSISGSTYSCLAYVGLVVSDDEGKEEAVAVDGLAFEEISGRTL